MLKKGDIVIRLHVERRLATAGFTVGSKYVLTSDPDEYGYEMKDDDGDHRRRPSYEFSPACVLASDEYEEAMQALEIMEGLGRSEIG